MVQVRRKHRYTRFANTENGKASVSTNRKLQNFQVLGLDPNGSTKSHMVNNDDLRALILETVNEILSTRPTDSILVQKEKSGPYSPVTRNDESLTEGVPQKSNTYSNSDKEHGFTASTKIASCNSPPSTMEKPQPSSLGAEPNLQTHAKSDLPQDLGRMPKTFEEWLFLVTFTLSYWAGILNLIDDITLAAIRETPSRQTYGWYHRDCTWHFTHHSS